MADEYKIAVERANYKYKAATEALREIRIILGYMSAFHIKTMTGTSFTLGEPDILTGITPISPAIGVPNIAEAVVLVKNKLDKLRKVFYPVFKKEFKPLSPPELDRYKCFSAADLFKSSELVSALNKVYVSMTETARKINLARNSGNAAAADTPNKQMTSAALTSTVPATYRLFDKQTSNNTIAEEYKEKEIKLREEQTRMLNEAISEKEDFPLDRFTQQNTPSHQFDIFGLTPRIPNSVADTATEFSMWLLSKQYPKGMKYCNEKRTQSTNARVSTTNLRRDQAISESGEQATHLSSLGTSATTTQTGAELTSSAAYNDVVNRIKSSIEELRLIANNTELPQDRIQSLLSRLISLDLSMRNSDDLQAQKDYMTLINGLGQEAEALKASYGPSYRAKQEALTKALDAQRSSPVNRSSESLRPGTTLFGGENEAKVQTSRNQLENVLNAPKQGQLRTPSAEVTRERTIKAAAQNKKDTEESEALGRSAEEELLKNNAALQASAGISR